MLLFFVLSLVAGYTGRNLIFEQRIAGNQFQATTSFDAAEAGLDWAISQLNGSRIDEACATTNDLTKSSFRELYLGIDPATGIVTPQPGAAGALRWAACVYNGTDWVCSCPSGGGPPSLTAPGGAGSHPAFAVRFEAETSRPGVVRAEVNGCPRYDLDCLRAVRTGSGVPSNNDCDSTVCALLALNSALRAVPVAALTARGSVDAGTGPLTVENADSATGITVRAGGTIDAAHVMVSAPGTPGELSKVATDSGLLALAVVDSDTCMDCLFSATFGLSRASYRRKQDVVELDCTATCRASEVRDAAALHPGRTLWLKGPGPGGGLSFDDNTAVGSASDPVTLIVEGPVSASAATPSFFGVLYASSVSLGSGGGSWRGAVLSSGNVTTTGPATVAFDRPLLDRLRFRQGSFVRVPGSWRDYQ